MAHECGAGCQKARAPHKILQLCFISRTMTYGLAQKRHFIWRCIMLLTVTPQEVCRVFDADEQQLNRWGHRGYLRSQRDGSYLVSELDAFLNRYGKHGRLTWQGLQRYQDTMLSIDTALRQFNLTENQF